MSIDIKVYLQALEDSDIQLVEDFLKKGADPNIRDQFDKPFLPNACGSRSNYELVKLLLHYKADPNIDDNAPILEYVSRSTDESILDLLIKHGADINTIDQGDGSNLLILAIRAGNLSVVYQLLKHDINVNPVNPDMESVFILAAKMGMKRLAKLLLDKGAIFDFKKLKYVDGKEIAQMVKDLHKEIKDIPYEELSDNCIETKYAGVFLEKGFSPHSSGNPNLTNIYTGKPLPYCTNRPIHLLTIDLKELDELPIEIKNIGLFHVVYNNCKDCDTDSLLYFKIGANGKLQNATTSSMDDYDEKEEKQKCNVESFANSEKVTWLKLQKKELDKTASIYSGIEVGGLPSWIQQPAWPSCNTCQKPMFFIARVCQSQVPPTVKGADNYLYTFICAPCKESAVVTQMT